MKHNKTFHQLFPDIPKSEDLIHGRLTVLKDIMKDFMKKKPKLICLHSSSLPAYICALQKEVPYHGRLYITDTNACFYSSVLLKDTKVDFSSPRFLSAYYTNKDIIILIKSKTFFFFSFLHLLLSCKDCELNLKQTFLNIVCLCLCPLAGSNSSFLHPHS